MRHGLQAFDGIERAKEDASGFAIGEAGEVEAVVHAIDEVDVGEAGRAEEHCVAWGPANEGVSGRIVGAHVGFDLRDAPDETLSTETANDELAEQSAGHDFG